MIYNDDQTLSPNEYQKMAESYAKTLQNKFVFVSLDNSKEEAFLHEVMALFFDVKNNLFALGGFLGTGAIYNLNEKHISKMQNLFNSDYDFETKHSSKDKVKCLLNYLSLESNLLNKLLSLAEQSSFAKELFEIIKERTHLLSTLFKVNSAIS